MKSLMPRSRATTAYGLLKAVQRLILAEPKRYNQDIYIEYKDDPDGLSTDGTKAEDFPACGTVGCVAGWIAALTRPDHTVGYYDARPIAEKVLGPSLDTFHLFGSSVMGPFSAPERFHRPELPRRATPWTFANHGAKPGTRTYAKAGVAHIQRFIDANLPALKARKVRIK